MCGLARLPAALRLERHGLSARMPRLLSGTGVVGGAGVLQAKRAMGPLLLSMRETILRPVIATGLAAVLSRMVRLVLRIGEALRLAVRTGGSCAWPGCFLGALVETTCNCCKGLHAPRGRPRGSLPGGSSMPTLGVTCGDRKMDSACTTGSLEVACRLPGWPKLDFVVCGDLNTTGTVWDSEGTRVRALPQPALGTGAAAEPLVVRLPRAEVG